jgi:predicted transcriptional regulator
MKRALTNLSRRERQIMDVIYREGQATATEVLAAIADPPSYSAVRAMLRVLENKGHLRHVLDGTRYVYRPTLARDRAGKPALENVLLTFFDGSTEKAVAALLDLSRSELSAQDFDRLSELITQAKTEGR